MKQTDDFYKGLKPLLAVKRLSIQGQKAHTLQTSIDQRGEQTINRDVNCQLTINSVKMVFE